MSIPGPLQYSITTIDLDQDQQLLRCTIRGVGYSPSLSPLHIIGMTDLLALK